MKKSIKSKILIPVMCLALVLSVPAVCLAAERGVPAEKSIEADGKTHSVYVFGTSLALVSTDGSIEISPIGDLTGVDVMIDGVITKNVSALNAPAGQRTRMSLEEGSVIVKGVTAESGQAVKQQISDAYAAGAETIDLAILGDVAAYQIDASGDVKNASGNKVNSSTIGVSVRSVEETVSTFTAELEEIRQAEIEAQAKANAATVSGNSIN